MVVNHYLADNLVGALVAIPHDIKVSIALLKTANKNLL